MHQKKDIIPPIQVPPMGMKRIYLTLGMPRELADPYVVDVVEGLMETCSKLAEPKISFEIHASPRFNGDTKTMELANQLFSVGDMVTSFLKKSSHMAVFVCTCGHEIERFSKKLMEEKHLLEGFIVDLIGSEIAEQLAEFTHQTITEEVAKLDMHVTNRYSPGYCNWPVSDQHKLFSLITDHCGITLTDTSLMKPIKSVSGVVGIGKEVKKMGYKCKFCDDEKCVMRKP